MKKKHFSIGLKQVFLKLDEILVTAPAQAEMKKLLGYPLSSKGTMFYPPMNSRLAEHHDNEAWKCGASMSVVIVNTNQVFCASAGDSRVVAHTIRGDGRFQVYHMDMSRDHRTSGKQIQ